MQVEILTYAPTEFYHCQHCEFVWNSVGVGGPIRDDQRHDRLPPELEAELTDIASWVAEAQARYGERLSVKLVDVASIEGVFKAVRHRLRRFPAFIVDGDERISGFNRDQLDTALERRLAY